MPTEWVYGTTIEDRHETLIAARYVPPEMCNHMGNLVPMEVHWKCAKCGERLTETDACALMRNWHTGMGDG